MSNPYARENLTTSLGSMIVYVPWAPASQWIRCTTSTAGLIGVLTGLTDDETADAVIDRALSGDVSPDQVSAAAYDLIGQAAPYRWWKTVRLLALSTRDDIAGHLTLEGLDPRRLTVGQWVAAVYVLVTRNADSKERFKVDVAFDDPPAGVMDVEPVSQEDFNAMVAAARAMPGQS